MSVNKFIGLGHVGKQPEIRQTQDGKQIASFSLALSESWKDKQGNKQEKTEWVNVVIFGGTASFVANYVNKGSKVYIEGKLQTRSYEDKQGVTKYVTEVVVQGFNSKIELIDKVGNKENAPQSNEGDNMGSDSVPF